MDPTPALCRAIHRLTGVQNIEDAHPFPVCCLGFPHILRGGDAQRSKELGGLSKSLAVLRSTGALFYPGKGFRGYQPLRRALFDREPM